MWLPVRQGSVGLWRVFVPSPRCRANSQLPKPAPGPRPPPPARPCLPSFAAPPPERHGQAGDGAVRHQLPDAHGHAGMVRLANPARHNRQPLHKQLPTAKAPWGTGPASRVRLSPPHTHACMHANAHVRPVLTVIPLAKFPVAVCRCHRCTAGLCAVLPPEAAGVHAGHGLPALQVCGGVWV